MSGQGALAGFGDDPSRTELTADHARELLRAGEMEVLGRLVEASNATLYCSVSLDGVSVPCVYKPVAGERPLWDFPDGTLAHREMAAYLVSEATGWGIVPPTVLREGRFGPGMCQLWIDSDPDEELVGLLRGGPAEGWLAVAEAVVDSGPPAVLAHRDDMRLRRMAVLDVVLNNADRKGGHLLPTRDGHVYGVDHGVCFATEDKLRTLLWGWGGERLPDDTIDVLTRLSAELARDLGRALREHLDDAEVAMSATRVSRLLRTRRHPEPWGRWPAVPWPPI
ncbi:MAG: SCO1664 family protein [Streptomycetales bacterium]